MKQLTYLAVKFNFFIIVNKVLTVFVTSEYSKCLPLVRIQSRRILLHGSMASTIMRVNNALFHSSRPAHQSDVASNDSYHAPLSGTIVAKLCPGFGSRMDGLRRYESITDGFTQLLRMTSLETLQTMIAVYDTHYM